MSEYIYSQTIIQFRQVVNTDGTLGKPEMVRSWVSPMKGYTGQYVKRKDKEVTQKKVAVQDKKLQVLQEKEDKTKKMAELKSQLQTTIGEVEYL